MRVTRIAGALIVIFLGRVNAADVPDPLAIWQDPTFQKQFLGSYGFQAELEPKMTPIERGELEKIVVVMAIDPDAAATQLKALATPESSAVFDFTLGNLRFQQDRIEEAGRWYRSAVDKFPSFRRAQKNLALTLVRRGACADALPTLTRVVELGGGDGLTMGLLGHCYVATDQPVSAESAYRNAVLLQPDVLDWKLGLAGSLLKQRKFAEATTLCDELIARFPDRSEYWMLQASAYLGSGATLKAAENFELLARMGKASAATLYALGDIYTNEGMWDSAARSYRRALDRDLDAPLDRPLRCVEILVQRGAIDQASELLARLTELRGERLDDPERKRLLKLEARIAVARGTGGSAVTVLEQIVSLDPLDGEALLLLGQHYSKNNEPDRASFYYERAEGLDGFEAEARLRRAQILVGQSKYREAVPLIRRAQELAPRDELARYLDQVERMARTR